MRRASFGALRLGGAAALLLALAGACDQSATLGSRWVKQVAVTAAAGATISISAAESADLAGAALAIGPGDLAADLVVTVEPGLAALASERAAGPVVIWGPAGTSFVRPVAMTLPFKLAAGQSAADLVVLVVGPSGALVRVEQHDLVVDGAGGLVHLHAPALGSFQPALERHCLIAPDCGGEEICRDGICRIEDDADGGHHGPDHP